MFWELLEIDIAELMLATAGGVPGVVDDISSDCGPCPTEFAARAKNLYVIFSWKIPGLLYVKLVARGVASRPWHEGPMPPKFNTLTPSGSRL